MITVKVAKDMIEKKFPDSVINSIMQLSSGYLFSIKPKNWNKNDILLDGFFKVSNVNGKITEYSPVMDPEEFKNAMKNTIYKK